MNKNIFIACDTSSLRNAKKIIKDTKTKKLKIGNGMDPDTQLGPLTTQKRLNEIETLNGGLSDTVKAVAEELQVKPSVINKAIKIAHKGDWSAHNADWEEIEAILDITKRI